MDNCRYSFNDGQGWRLAVAVAIGLATLLPAHGESDPAPETGRWWSCPVSAGGCPAAR